MTEPSPFPRLSFEQRIDRIDENLLYLAEVLNGISVRLEEFMEWFGCDTADYERESP